LFVFIITEDIEINRKFTRCAYNPLTCYRGHGTEEEDDELEDIEVANMEKMENMNEDGPDDTIDSNNDNKITFPTSAAPDPNRDPAVILLSGVMPDEMEEIFIQEIDSIAPDLASTPKLQDKAIRAVMAYGHEMIWLDADISANLGKLNLTENDIVEDSDVEELFETFMIPKEIIDDLKLIDSYDTPQLVADNSVHRK
jgi:hypothetical protein